MDTIHILFALYSVSATYGLLVLAKKNINFIILLSFYGLIIIVSLFYSSSIIGCRSSFDQTDFSFYFCNVSGPDFLFALPFPRQALRFVGLNRAYPVFIAMWTLSLSYTYDLLSRLYDCSIRGANASIAKLIVLTASISYFLISPSAFYGLLNVSAQFLSFFFSIPLLLCLTLSFNTARLLRSAALPLALLAVYIHSSAALFILLGALAIFLAKNISFAKLAAEMIIRFALPRKYMLIFTFVFLLSLASVLCFSLVAKSLNYSYYFTADAEGTSLLSLGNFALRFLSSIFLGATFLLPQFCFLRTLRIGDSSAFAPCMLQVNYSVGFLFVKSVSLLLLFIYLIAFVVASLSPLAALRWMYYADWTCLSICIVGLIARISETSVDHKDLAQSFPPAGFVISLRSLSCVIALFALYLPSLWIFVVEPPQSMKYILSSIV